MFKIFLIFLSITDRCLALDIIPYDKASWTKFEKLPSMKIMAPVLVNKEVKGIGLIKEEIKPKIVGKGAVDECKELNGIQEKKFCKVDDQNTVTYVFSKEFKKGIFYQSVSFEKKYSKAIKKFETGLK